MPRRPEIRRALAVAIVALPLFGFAPPELLRAALADAAGTIFETLPFVLAGALLPRGGPRGALALLGCGCRAAPGPAALSLPAFALTWFVFGREAALARGAWLAVVALGSRWFGQRRGPHAPHAAHTGAPPEPRGPACAVVATLSEIAGCAVLGSLAAEAARAYAAPALQGLAPSIAWGAALAGGAILGALAPCATAAVALAGILRGVHPALVVGIFASAATPLRFSAVPRWARRRAGRALDAGDPRFPLALVGAAALTMIAAGDRGFVNARLLPPLACAAVASLGLSFAYRPSASRRGRLAISALLAPAILFAALGAGAPLPTGRVQSALDGAAAGERFAFVGELRDGGRELTRATIVCCRADARLVGIRLVRADPHPDGAWLDARGLLVERDGRLELDIASARAIPAPRDPFAYW